MFQEILDEIRSFLEDPDVRKVVEAVVVGLIGLVVVRLIAIVLTRAGKALLSDRGRQTLRRMITLIGLTVVVLVVLARAGVSIAALLSAAGVIGIAVGFAAQTSLSNIISGLFMVGERAFQIGDVLQIGTSVGIVESVDLLSVKLRTFDNRYVRIPNDSLLRQEFVNITHYPIRRLDVNVTVAFEEDIAKVREAMFAALEDVPVCLDRPEPLFMVGNIGPYGVSVLFGVWFSKTDYVDAKNGIVAAVLTQLREREIRIVVPPVIAQPAGS